MVSRCILLKSMPLIFVCFVNIHAFNYKDYFFLLFYWRLTVMLNWCAPVCKDKCKIRANDNTNYIFSYDLSSN